MCSRGAWDPPPREASKLLRLSACLFDDPSHPNHPRSCEAAFLCGAAQRWRESELRALALPWEPVAQRGALCVVSFLNKPRHHGSSHRLGQRDDSHPPRDWHTATVDRVETLLSILRQELGPCNCAALTSDTSWQVRCTLQPKAGWQTCGQGSGFCDCFLEKLTSVPFSTTS